MELFKLFGTIAVNNKDANSAIDETSEKAEGFGSKLKKGVSTVAKWGTAVVGGATVAAGALVKFAESSSETTDNIDKMSQRLGMSRTAYQEWDYVLSQAGVDIDSMRVGFKTLTNTIGDVTTAGSTAGTAFEALGISFDDIKGKSQEDIFALTVSRLQDVDDQTKKATLAQDLFGRSGQEMIPLLNATSKSTEELRNRAHDLGMVLDDETVSAGVSLHDTIDTLKRSISTMVTKLGASLMPIVEKVANYVISYMPKIQALFRRLEPIVTGLLDGLLPPLMDLAEQLLPIIFDLIEQLLPPITQIISGVLPIITNLLTTLLPPLIQIVQILLPPLMEIINKLLPVVTRIIEAVLPVLTSYLDYVMAILEVLMPILDPILDLLLLLLEPLLQYIELVLPIMSKLLQAVATVISTVVKPIITWVAEFLSGVFSGALEAIQTLISKVKDAFKDAWQGIKDAWSGAGDFFNKIWEGIKKAFGAVADWFKNIFSKAWQAVKNVFSTGGKIFDGIKDGIVTAFKAVVNAIIRGINKVIAIPFKAINAVLSKINGISILGVRPFSWVHTFNVPQIPQLAKGGVLPKGKTGYLEGDGAEAVVPLEKNTEWTLQVAKQIFEFSESKEKEKPKDTVINISLNIEKFVNEREQDLKELAETISELLAAQIRRKELSF